MGRRLCHRRYARPQAAEAVPGHADAEKRFSARPDVQPARSSRSPTSSFCSSLAIWSLTSIARAITSAFLIAVLLGGAAFAGIGLLGRQPGGDARNGLGSDEPRHAADVDFLRRLLFVGAISRSRSAADQPACRSRRSISFFAESFWKAKHSCRSGRKGPSWPPTPRRHSAWHYGFFDGGRNCFSIARRSPRPSPTGPSMSVTRRTYLLAWLSIRSRGGRIILRMEDIDSPRVKRGAAEQAIEDLRWLGLDWDEGPDIGGPHAPYVQTQRLELYREALERAQSGRARLSLHLYALRRRSRRQRTASWARKGPSIRAPAPPAASRTPATLTRSVERGIGGRHSPGDFERRTNRGTSTIWSRDGNLQRRFGTRRLRQSPKPTAHRPINSPSSSMITRWASPKFFAATISCPAPSASLNFTIFSAGSLRSSPTCRWSSAPTAAAWPSGTATRDWQLCVMLASELSGSSVCWHRRAACWTSQSPWLLAIYWGRSISPSSRRKNGRSRRSIGVAAVIIQLSMYLLSFG